MKEPIEWTLSETFQFPAAAGSVSGVNDVKVTAGYQDDQTEDAVRLSGIYHIAANVALDANRTKDTEDRTEGAILIDDVEIEGANGYFEYAVPLEVDLPAAEGAVVTASVVDSTASATDGGDLLVMWTVQASVEQPAAPAAAPVATAAEEKGPAVSDPAAAADTPQQPALETAELPAEAEGADAVAAEAADGDSSSVTVLAAGAEDSSHHELLAFIRDLEDGVTVTPFDLNNVFVE